jgi:hypothetical protein
VEVVLEDDEVLLGDLYMGFNRFFKQLKPM